MPNRCWILSCLFLLLLLGAAEAAEFTADLALAEGKIVKTGRIMVRGDLYRMEIKDPRGPDVVVQMFPGKDLCRVLVPRYSLYMEMARTEGIVRMFDPFLALEAMKEHYECVPEGTEDWGGQACAKEVFKHKDKAVAYRWISRELGFPLRIQMVARDDYFTKLTNVKVEAVSEELFAIPAGYEKSESEAIAERASNDPEMKAKRAAWEAMQPRRNSLNARLTEGGEYRALLGKDLAIKVHAGRWATSDFVWSVTGVKSGEALPAKEMTGPGEIEFAADSGVNLVIIKCVKGEVLPKIDVSGLGTLVLATKTVHQQKSGGGPGGSPPPGVTGIRVRVKSLEVPGESTLPVRITLTLYPAEGSSGEKEKLKHRLEPGQEKTFEKIGKGVLSSYDLSLPAPGGRAEVEITIDRRPKDEQKPF